VQCNDSYLLHIDNLHLPLRRVRECLKLLHHNEKQEPFLSYKYIVLGDTFRVALQIGIKVTLTLSSVYLSYSRYIGRKLIKQESSLFGSTQNSNFQLEVGNAELTKGNRSISNCLKLNSK